MRGREGRRRLVPRRATSFQSIALLMLVPITGILLFLGWRFLSTRHAVAVTSRPAIPALAPRTAVTAPATRVEVASLSARPSRPARIVLILDDVGFDHQQLAQAMRIDPNLNFAVIPNGVRASEAANELHAGGFEILCHMPMEPDGYPGISPGAGAILTSMSDAEIRATTSANLHGVPYARGVNNHMGSRATADSRVMSNVLASFPRGTYFIDSRTTPHSIGEQTAKALHVPTAARNVFLDDVQSEPAIRRQLAELVSLAESRGLAIGIGHIYPVTVKVLSEEVPSLRARGVQFVRASVVVN